MSTKSPTNPNQSVALIGILFILAGFGLAYYVFVPQLIQARTEEAKAVALLGGRNADIATLETAKRDMGKARDELTSKGVDFTQLRNNFPLTESMPDVYLQLEDIIRINPNVKKIEYQVGQPTVDPLKSGVKIPVSMTATGSYGELKNLIVSLQTNMRPFILTQVGLAAYTPPKEETDIPAGSFVASIIGYTLTETVSASYTTPTK